MDGHYSYIKLRLYSLDEGGCHVVVSGLVNGKKATFIVDTGSSKTVLDSNAVGKYIEGCDKQNLRGKAVTLSEKSIDVEAVTVAEISFGKTVISDCQCVAIDLSGVQKAYEEFELPPIQGIIGCDLLRSMNAVIDFKTLRMRLSR